MGCSIESGDPHDDLVNCLRSKSMDCYPHRHHYDGHHHHTIINNNHNNIINNNIHYHYQLSKVQFNVFRLIIFIQISSCFKYQPRLHRVQQGGPSKWRLIKMIITMMTMMIASKNGLKSDLKSDLKMV